MTVTETHPLEVKASVEQHCLLCGEDQTNFRPFAKRHTWQYFRCSNCSFVFIHPPPSTDTLRSFYNTSYSVKRDAYANGAKQRAPSTLRVLRKHLPTAGRMLEVGCSHGFFLHEARRAGWDTTGVELNEKAAFHAKRNLGLRVYCGDLESQLDHLREPFDLVVLFHLIEHVPEPNRLLRLCQQITKRDGLLLLRTPNIDSLAAKLAGSGWQWLAPPAHLHLYSPHTLRVLLEKNGFRTLEMWSEQGDAHSNLFEFVCSVGRRALARNLNRDLAHATSQLADRWQINMIRVAMDFCYFPFRFVVDPWLSRWKLQPELSVIAVKRSLS